MKKCIIGFEGLFSFDRKGVEAAIQYQQGTGSRPKAPLFGGYLLHELILPMIERGHDFDFKIYPWTQIYRCAQILSNISYSRESMNIIIGHSFGAPTAIRVAELLIASEMPTSLLTLDCRCLPFSSGRFRSPIGTHSPRNYYQRGLLRGYPVEYAINITLKDVGHGGVPGHPRVVEYLDGYLKGK